MCNRSTNSKITHPKKYISNKQGLLNACSFCSVSVNSQCRSCVYVTASKKLLDGFFKVSFVHVRDSRPVLEYELRNYIVLSLKSVLQEFYKLLVFVGQFTVRLSLAQIVEANDSKLQSC